MVYDIFTDVTHESAILKWCDQNNYEILELSNTKCSICIDNKIRMDINKYGIIVFNEMIDVSNKSPEDILIFKEQLNNSILHENNIGVTGILFDFEKFIHCYYRKKQLKRIESKWQTKIHYTLSSYLFSTIKVLELYKKSSFITNEIIWLLSKKNPVLYDNIGLDYILEENSAKNNNR